QEASDLLVSPELFLVGYPPRDLLERTWFIEKTETALQTIIGISEAYPQTGILLGIPRPNENPAGKGLYNSAVLVYQGEILGCAHKSLLPIYDVFDEARYFDPAMEVEVFAFKDEVLGISICEDAWNDPELWPRRRMYNLDPIDLLAQKGATIMINLSASPFYVGKEAIRCRLISNHARRHRLPFFYVNQVGANDELIFDGRSLCIDREGELVWIGPAFQEAMETIDSDSVGEAGPYIPQERVESIYLGLVLGIKDYMSKCGFKQAVLGLSGGIDSALVACLACQALGAENVLAISMPSPYSSSGSIEDSRQLSENLKLPFKVISISPIFETYMQNLNKGTEEEQGCDIMEQNIQARIRGNILMAYSNRYGYLVLSTGNKSEMAVGYCTLYGDMSGGLSVLSDVPKTVVYELASYINRKQEVIPAAIINKAPSAELKPDQTDQDELPPYEVLDQILHHYVEEGWPLQRLIEMGFEKEAVNWVVKAVDRNEYKRLQAAPGLKVTTKAFGLGRRMPVAVRIPH
ncbi:MAG: NAD+ synthase, partial [Syntrophomonadaceae bacterium]|nr:NAD+ synthase [Syntrophomonadaceae bacterium]